MRCLWNRKWWKEMKFIWNPELKKKICEDVFLMTKVIYFHCWRCKIYPDKIKEKHRAVIYPSRDHSENILVCILSASSYKSLCIYNKHGLTLDVTSCKLLNRCMYQRTMGRSTVSQQAAWVGVSALSLTNGMTLGKILNHSADGNGSFEQRSHRI